MTVEIVNPTTGRVDYRHELLDKAGIEQRLQAAAGAFPAWSATSLQERAAVLRAIGAQLRERKDDIQGAMTREMGKLKVEALAEVEKCAAACEYYADHAADYLKPQLIDTEAQRSYVRYEPIGCVFAVMPWNFP
ncbi:MAG: aldehyde dehydrogenase family protein, partial [Stenotrophomonas chelatiphaga]